MGGLSFYLLLAAVIVYVGDSLIASARWSWSRHTVRRTSARHDISMSTALGGKIIVTGIGKVDEDEFMLNLLNEQSVWDSVVLATEDSAVTQKRFLSRTARYSGLLNILNFATTDLAADDQLKSLLDGASAWLAFNVTQSSIERFSEAAVTAGVKRAIFTMELPAQRINETSMPEMNAAIAKFEKAGASFTGIRHGEIIEGDENNPYEIFNSSIPCLEPTVERGVLARVAAELLMIDSSSNKVCGVSSAGEFARAYLAILRSSGLTRKQEVTKLFSGGLQRVAQLSVENYEAEQARIEERKILAEKRRIEEEKELKQEQEEATALAKLGESGSSSALAPRKAVDPNASITPGWDEDEEKTEPTVEEKIIKRTEEILKSVWIEFETRMYAKSTSKSEFYDANRPMARQLAEKEAEEEAARLEADSQEKEAKQRLVDRLVDVNRQQYSKLLALERKEMQNQKEISDTWVRYIYLLLERTIQKCKESGTLFHNMDEFGQTLLLRQQANELRAQCSPTLPSYDAIYDPLDAAAIIASQPAASKNDDIDALLVELESRHGNTLRTVPALRGAKQIVALAIETLKAELPVAPPAVNDLRRAESSSKQQLVSQSRLAQIKNKGMPKGDDSSVGRM